MALVTLCGAIHSKYEPKKSKFIFSFISSIMAEQPHLRVPTLAHVPTAGHNSVILALSQAQGACLGLKRKTTYGGQDRLSSGSGELRNQRIALKQLLVGFPVLIMGLSHALLGVNESWDPKILSCTRNGVPHRPACKK